MTEIYAPDIPAGVIPDDQTIPQFFLDKTHSLKPAGAAEGAGLVEDATGRRISMDELRARTYGLANELKSRWNVGEDDVVCLFSPNHVDWPVVLWATLRLGAIVTPVNPSYMVDELVHPLTLTKACLLITHSSSLATAISAARAAGLPLGRIAIIDSCPPSAPSTHATVDELISSGLAKPPAFTERQFKPGESKTKLALLCFSSGTTGKPKAVAVSHYSMIANVIQARLAIGMAPRYVPGDVILGVLPFFHVFGMVIVLHTHLWIGATVVVVPKFSFESFLNSIQRYRVKHLMVVPPMIVLLCKHPLTKKYVLNSVRWLTSGAAPLTGELMRQLAALIPECSIGQGYGLTETFTTVSLSRNDEKIATPGTAGVLVPGIVARVVKVDGTLARRGELGELWVRGPSIALGYYKNPEATKETFPDGWVRTGDEVTINEKNELFILDRMKEILKVRGFQVAPAELEGHLLDHPDVADACVVGIPHEYHGEVPLAFIVPSAAAQERLKGKPEAVEKAKSLLAKHVADTKVEYKHLTGGIVFVDSIPKNPSGKLLRRVLRDQARAMMAADKRNKSKAKSARL